MLKLISKIKFGFLMAWVLCFLDTSLYAADGGSGKSFNYGAGANFGYHPVAQTWVQGQRDDATYTYTGYSWLAYFTNLEPKKNGGGFTPPTFAIWGDVLTNTYDESDPSGSKAKEVIKTQGLGLGLIHRDSTSGIAGAFLIGLERAYLDQSGDTPRSQKYPYGVSSRVGLGWSPIRSNLAIDLRVDWVFKHFPSTQSNGDNLKVMQQQSFVPMVGLSYNQ